MIVLVTGCAGFIGSALCGRLLGKEAGISVVGVDNLNPYYDVSLKQSRLDDIASAGGSRWTFLKGDIADKEFVDKVFAECKPDYVVNLAAQAGVRYSITAPEAYVSSNLMGFFNILEACRHSYDGGESGVRHLVYASSSSVYGADSQVPYSTADKADHPVSLYAATKRSNELMAYAYSKLYDIPATGLRFFTVYGPAGRPDMAYFSFADKLVAGEDITLFNNGDCLRDFTFVDDIVSAVAAIITAPPARSKGEDGLPVAPHRLYNIGNSHPENLCDFVRILCEELSAAGVLAEDFDWHSHVKYAPMQPGDVPVTYADVSALEADFGFRPATSLREGLRSFARWYASYNEKKEMR